MKNKEMVMEVFSNNPEIVEARKAYYFQEALKLYPNPKKLTLTKFKLIKKEFDNGDETASVKLMEESTFDILKAASKVYAMYDVEKYVSFEEGLSFMFERLMMYHQNYNYLPKSRVMYLSSIIQTQAFQTINKIYYSRKLHDRITFMKNEDLTWLIDKQDCENFSFEEFNKQDFAETFDKLSDNLRENEKRVIDLVFGFETGEPMTYAKAGEVLGITRSRVYELLQQAFKKINKSKQFKKLKEFSEINFSD